jgi:hypothetical protein
VVHTDDLASARARGVNGGEVIVWINQEPCAAGIKISSSVRLFDARRRTNQQAAALVWQRLARVRDDRVDGSKRDFYKASTAIAMPIPPPMQSDATP